MAVVQRTGEGSKPRIPCVVSKSDRDHGTATTDNRNLGLTSTVTIPPLSLPPVLLLAMGSGWRSRAGGWGRGLGEDLMEG